MDWLARLLFGEGGTAVPEALREGADSTPNARSGPPLMVLVNDASGRASFKTHVFDDAESASEWVRYWFPQEADGLTAFWAMTEWPEGGLDSGAEPLVMIRDTSRDGVMYLFSFVDIESARMFLRDEVERGTQLDAMMLYWSVPVRVEIDRWGRIMLTPSTPPAAAATSEPVCKAPQRDGWVVRQEPPALESARKEPVGNPRALLEEAPNALTGVAELMDAGRETFELTSWMDHPRRRATDRPDHPRRRMTDRLEGLLETSVRAIDYAEVVPCIEPVVEEATSALEETLEESEPEVGIEVIAAEEALEGAELKVVIEATGPVEEVTEEGESEAQVEAVVEAEAGEVDEHQTRVGASTYRNGHKPPQASDLLIDTNGHRTDRDVVAEVGENEPAPAVEPRLPEHEKSLPINRHVAANEHSAELTSPNGEGTEVIEPGIDHNGRRNGRMPEQGIVHEWRVDANRKGWRRIRTMALDYVVRRAEAIGRALKKPPLWDMAPPSDEAIDIVWIFLESRALKVKRWEVRDEPFEGFKSPPGKF